MLENAYNNGKWINPKDKTWPKDNKFKMKNTLRKIKEKGGKYTRKTKKFLNYILVMFLWNCLIPSSLFLKYLCILPCFFK